MNSLQAYRMSRPWVIQHEAEPGRWLTTPGARYPTQHEAQEAMERALKRRTVFNLRVCLDPRVSSFLGASVA